MLKTSIIEDTIEIDTLVSMIKMAYTFENWEKVISLSVELHNLASEIHNMNMQHKTLGTPKSHQRMNKSIVFYYGYSLLMKGLGCQKLKLYSEAMECIKHYSDLSWVDDGSETRNKIVSDFQLFAKANLYTLKLLMGDISILPEYMEFLKGNEQETLSGLITILETAMKHDVNIDNELKLLIHYVKDFDEYEDRIFKVYYLNFNYLLILYRYKNKHFTEAIEATVHSLICSDKIGEDKFFKKTMVLFEELRSYASDSQIKKYMSIIEAVFKSLIESEKIIDLDNVDISMLNGAKY